jgi:hypothetical protein
VTDLTTDRTAELLEPGVAPGPADREPADPAAALPEGVELSRLLALVRLTAPQALEIAVGLLTGAARREDQDPGSSDRDPVVLHRAMVSTDGQVVLGPAPVGGGSRGPEAVAATGAALVAVLDEVAGAARLRGRPADPAAEQLLTELDRASTDLPHDGVLVVAARLQETVAGLDRPAVRAELAALVRAVRDRAASAGGPAPAASGSTVVRTAPARRVPRRGSRTALRRIGAWLLSLVVLAAGVVLEIVVLRDEIAADVARLLDAGRSGAASSAAPEPDGVPIDPPAPAAAGSVAAVDLRPLAGCAPGAPCTLALLVRLVPGAEPQEVAWSYRIVDRCTGAAATVPGGTVTAPAGGQRVAAVGTVTLPSAQAVAVLAVSSLPAEAASAPVFAGSCLPDRPTG